MKTTDLFKSNRSAKRINESMEKMFGTKLDLASFDLPKLEDARNKIRTQLSQVRGQSGFNENIENEAVTQAQWMLDAINSEIAERQEFIADPHQATVEYDTTEGFGTLEDEVRSLLKQFDDNANEIGAYGMPDEDKIVALLQKGDFEGAAEEVWYAYSDQDGGEVPQIEPYVQDLQDEFEVLAQGGDEDHEGGETDDAYALASAGHGSDEDYESIEQESAPKGWEGTVKAMKKHKEIDNPWALAHYMKNKGYKSHKKESVETGDNMTRRLTEGEVQQASAIVTAKTMVDRISRWIEELAGMENDQLLQLGDTIRDEMSADQAKQFISQVAPAIQQALQNLKDTRETMATGVRMLTGEEQGAEMLGSEPGAEPGMGDEMGATEPDMMNTGGEGGLDDLTAGADDEFGASDAAAGGLEAAGREQRESVEYSNRLLKVLAG